MGEIVRVVNHGVSKARLSKLSDIKNKNEKLATITWINWQGTKELRDNHSYFFTVPTEIPRLYYFVRRKQLVLK